MPIGTRIMGIGTQIMGINTQNMPIGTRAKYLLFSIELTSWLICKGFLVSIFCNIYNSLTKDICTEICGDGIRFNSFSTYCDDANKINGDGCNSSCSVETGWKCTGGDSTTKDKCDEICGDGIRFNSNSTYCDDGNKNNGDGCNSSCSIEVGWSCLGGTTSNKDICTEICGDGIRFNSTESYCDDGNKISGDGCSSLCSIETGYKCTGGSIKQKN